MDVWIRSGWLWPTSLFFFIILLQDKLHTIEHQATDQRDNTTSGNRAICLPTKETWRILVTISWRLRSSQLFFCSSWSSVSWLPLWVTTSISPLHFFLHRCIFAIESPSTACRLRHHRHPLWMPREPGPLIRETDLPRSEIRYSGFSLILVIQCCCSLSVIIVYVYAQRNRSSGRLEKIETDLAQARAAIRRAIRTRNYTSDREEKYIPTGSVYRNSFAFHQ